MGINYLFIIILCMGATFKCGNKTSTKYDKY